MPYRAMEGRVTYGGETEWVHLDTEGRNVLLLELAGQMTLDKGRLWGRFVSIGAIAGIMALFIRRSGGAHRPPDSAKRDVRVHTFPVPPSPTSTSLKVGVAASAMVVSIVVAG
jgi:hypothetical protein